VRSMPERQAAVEAVRQSLRGRKGTEWSDGSTRVPVSLPGDPGRDDPALVPGGHAPVGTFEIRHPANPSIIVPTHWDTRRLPIRCCSARRAARFGIDIATLEAEIQAAFDAWQALPTSAAAFTFGGQVVARDADLGGALALGVDGGTRHLHGSRPGVRARRPALSLTTSFTGDFVVTAANADLDGDGTPDLPEGPTRREHLRLDIALTRASVGR